MQAVSDKSMATKLSIEPEHERDLALTKRIFIGLAAGTMAGFSVAPFVTTIDKSIVENASGAATMKQSIRNSVREILTRYVEQICIYNHFCFFVCMYVYIV